MKEEGMDKKELIQFFEDDLNGKYPLGFDEALLLIAEYLDDKHITEWINKFVDELSAEIMNKTT